MKVKKEDEAIAGSLGLDDNNNDGFDEDDEGEYKLGKYGLKRRSARQ